jgi:tyrosine-protein phosphatase YwqE
MFNLFEKHISLAQSGLLQGFTDWHSHLLPGVDDGVMQLDDTLQLLRLYESQGIRHVWFTPHVMEDIPNDPSTLRAEFARVKQAYQGPVTLHLAAEYMLDNLFEQHLRRDDLLPLGDDSHLLVETSYFRPPMDLPGILRRIQRAGYHPVLAHPERYVYMTQEDYRRLHQNHVLLQLNLFSLQGQYGRTAQRKAIWLVKQGLIDRVGTDTHRITQFQGALEGKIGARMVKALQAFR